MIVKPFALVWIELLFLLHGIRFQALELNLWKSSGIPKRILNLLHSFLMDVPAFFSLNNLDHYFRKARFKVDNDAGFSIATYFSSHFRYLADAPFKIFCFPYADPAFWPAFISKMLCHIFGRFSFHFLTRFLLLSAPVRRAIMKPERRCLVWLIFRNCKKLSETLNSEHHRAMETVRHLVP